MSFMDKMERKYGRYAIRNLPVIIVAVYAAGYLIQMLMPQMLGYLTLRPDLILKGQVWRVVSWVLMPPDSFDLLTILMLYIYFSFGRALEQTWGAFRFNVFILTGVILTVIGSFLYYAINPAYYTIECMFNYYSTYYINMSIFMALAFTYPDMQVLLYFLIPIKMKWMGIVYVVELVLWFYRGGWLDRTGILASVINLLLFFGLSRSLHRYSPKEVHRRQEFKRNVKKVQPKGATRHKCTICGRTEEDGEHLEFRYCSKCDGNYEYCQDHLFTHQHIKRQ